MVRTRNRVINATEEGKSIYSLPEVEALIVEGGATISVQLCKPGIQL